MYRPVAYAVGMFIAGLISGLNLFIMSLCVFCSVLYSYFIFSKRLKKSKSAFMFVLTSAIFVSLYFAGTVQSKRITEKSQMEVFINGTNCQEYVITGTVNDIIETDKGLKLKLGVEKAAGDGVSREFSKKEFINVYCDAKNDDVRSIKFGDRVEFSSEIFLYENARNEGGFDSKKYYLARNTSAYAYPEKIKAAEGVKQFSHSDPVFSIQKFLYLAKLYITNGIKKAFPKEQEGILAAMLTGEKEHIEENAKRLYQETGFAHILAISGLHISIIGMSVFGFLRKKEQSYTVSALFALGVLCVYNAFSGGQVSCKRAVIMLCLSLIARCLGEKYDSLTALSVAALIILLNKPHFIYDSSFVMSFSAGLGSSLFGERISKCEISAGERNKKIIKNLLYSICIQAALLPAQVEFFNTFCPYSIILNLLLLPLVSVLFISGMLTGIIAGLSMPIASVTSLPAKFILSLYSKALSFVMSLPASKTVTGHMTELKWLIVLFTVVLFCVCGVRCRKAGLFITLAPLILLIVPFNNDSLKIAQLYVGQGDCCVITCGKTAIAIDCGSSDEKQLYKYTVEPYLNYNGYEAFDYVFLSHADADHISGIEEYLAENGAGKTRIFIPSLEDGSGFQEIKATANENAVTEIPCGSKISLGEIRFTCLYPDSENREKSENETSMVIHLSYGDFSMLFMGDLPQEYEQYVLKNMDKYNLCKDIDILKAGHHGSRSSSGKELLETVKPEFAFISCAPNNSYGHPHAETLERLKAVKSKCLITAEEGEIAVEIKESRLRLLHY